MNFELTEEQKQIKSLTRQFCEREVDMKRLAEIAEKTSKAKSVEETRALQPLELWDKLHEVGLRQLAVPKKYGGTAPETDGSLIRAVAAEEVGYSAGPLGHPLGMLWFVCRSMATNKYITEEQREWFFSRFMENPRLMVGGTMSEPAGATDVHLPYDEPGAVGKVYAHKDGNEWVINGEKMFSSSSGVADIIQAYVRTNKEGPLSESMTIFWVLKDSPGLTYQPNRLIATGFTGNTQLLYEDVRVPESNMIGQLNKGYSIIESIFTSKWTATAPMLGTMQKLYEHMRDFASHRIGGGKPIIEHTNVASKLGELATGIEALRALLYKTAWETEQAEKAGRICWFWNLAYYTQCKKLAWRFCDIAPDIYGGIVASLDFPIEGFLRGVYVTRAAGLTLEMQLIKASIEYDNRYA